MGMTPGERADRIYELSKRDWCRQVTGIMSSRYMVYHWSMPVLLGAEAVVLLFLAIWPLWGGALAFIGALTLFDQLNEWVAYLAWRRYDRLRSEEEDK